jgi:PAS domain S-box-containing protein
MVWAYLAAFLLPVLATLITTQLQLLDHIPGALFLASIALTSWFGFTLPSMLAVALSLILFNIYIMPPIGQFSGRLDDVVRQAVIGLAAVLISLLILRLKKTRAALAASEAFYRTTLSSIGDGVIATDLNGAVTFMNFVAEDLTGWSEAEVKGKLLDSFFQITTEETGATVENPVEKVRRLGTVVVMANHTSLERRDGTSVPIDDCAAPIVMPDGAYSGIVLVFRDMQERRESEKQQQALFDRAREAEAEMRDLLAVYEEQSKALSLAQQAGKCAAWVLDVEKQEVKWIPGGFEIFGIPFADFVGRVRPITMVEPEDRVNIEAALQKTLDTGLPFTPEFRVRWPNGEMRWQEARGILDPENPKIIRGTTFDVTDRKKTELSLLRVEKLAAVGRIASTIAHEINNPLASVTNLLYLSLLEESLPGPVRNYLLTAQEELSRLASVTRLTLSYARPHSQGREVDPVEVIESVLNLFHVRLEAKGIKVVRAFPVPAAGLAAPVRVVVFADELQRIITNLLANAIDAVGVSDGLIRIAVERQGAEALLAMEDNGSGIPDDHRHRIFDPFFTTKEEVGTGIGLWVTKELAEKNGGSVVLGHGSPAHGTRTRFEVRFPASEASQQMPASQIA